MSEQRRKVGPEPLSEDGLGAFRLAPRGRHRPPGRGAPPDLRLGRRPRQPDRPRPAEVPATADGLRCEMLFRHDTHTQTVMSLDVPAVIAVAPAAVDFSAPDDADAIRVFRLEPLEPLVLTGGPGTGARFRSRRPRCGSSMCKACATPRTMPASTWPPGPRRRRGAVAVAVRTSMEIDETEFMSGTVPELVAAITAREVEPGTDGRETFVTKSPDWWGGDRTFGGMVVAQALHAATRRSHRGSTCTPCTGTSCAPHGRGQRPPTGSSGCATAGRSAPGT